MWRQAQIDAALKDKGYAAELWQMCAEDLLFFTNGFVWILEPRDLDCPETQFLTFPNQDYAMLKMLEHLGTNSLVFEKSRCQGATWMCLTLFDHRFIFYRQNHFKICSQKAENVENPTAQGALFSKVDFIHEHLPSFLAPTVRSAKMRRTNTENGSTIIGAATTDDIARGDRCTGLFIDEYAAYDVTTSWQVKGALTSVTNTVIYCSTHKGEDGAFYATTQNPRIPKIQMHWSDNPFQNPGLYTYRDGKLVILDKDYDFPPNYPFISTDTHGQPLEGQPRSPYYDKECLETLNGVPSLIARELDCDPKGSGNQFFMPGVLAAHKQEFVVPPYSIGDLIPGEHPHDPVTWLDNPEGRCKLWVNLDADGNPLEHLGFVLSADIAAGTGASNSGMVAYDKFNNTKVLEYASPFIDPSEFALLFVGTQRWLNGAKAIWDATGPLGKLFSKTYLDSGGKNYFHRTDDDNPAAKPSDKPGYVFGPGMKIAVFGAYLQALRKGLMINRSADALDEASHFVYTNTGTVEHAGASNTLDPTGAKNNHGDICTADVLACRMLNTTPSKPRSESLDEVRRGRPPKNSIAWVMEQDGRNSDTEDNYLL
jgi:hypothetical protein